MSQQATAHTETAYSDENTLPSDEDIIDEISLPDEWDAVQDASDNGYGGYAVTAILKSRGDVQGSLLADRKYNRVACVLVPSGDFSKYTIEASPAVGGDADLSGCLGLLEYKIEQHEEKLASGEN